MNFRIVAAIAALGTMMTTSAVAADAKQIVNAAMNKLMVEKDASAVETYFAAPYIQHNQTVPSGIEGLKALAVSAIAGNPDFKYKLARTIADGDIGVTHGVYEGLGPVPLVGFDVFRIEGGKIVEHWDNLTAVTPANPSGHTQIDGTLAIIDLDKTEANKALISNFLDAVLVHGRFDKIATYFDGDKYVQHNSNVPDGVTGLSSAIQAMAKQGIKMVYTKTHKVIGEGNFVFAMSEGTFGGKPTAYYDLFRVENGKIAEHWDVIADEMPPDQAKNSNGKF
jgi:predicted SnoaL-like aldol condensation-catalyzing enzyme